MNVQTNRNDHKASKPEPSFPKFDRYVCEGDSVSLEIDGFTVTARIYRDDCSDRPDERQDGFWPSLDPNDAGYIGPKSKSTLARHMAKAKAIVKAWENDEWFYCGVCLTVEKEGVQLTGRYDHALWGVECNYPGSDNSYLTDVAHDLLDEALEAAREKLEALCS